MRTFLLLVALIAFMAVSPLPGQVVASASPLLQKAEKKNTGADSGARSLKEVLQEFKKHYAIDILFFNSTVEGIVIPGKDIRLEENPEKSLRTLLQNSGLTYKKSKNGGYVIIARKKREDAAMGQSVEKTIGNFPGNREIDLEQPTTPDTEIESPPAIEKPVRGKVTDENGEGLPGVSILLKETQKGATTDAAGHFSIDVPDENAILLFSFVGYISQEVVVGNRTTLDISLTADTKALEEVVVTALGISKESKALTYSTQKINGEELSRVKDMNYVNSLAGKVAGAVITRGTMGPGSATRVLIRGNKSLTGNSSPLYVIDGVPSSIEFNPDDIESIQILPGASAAALYGSQAANGVVLITTKKGKKGNSRIDFSSSLTFDEATDLPKLQTTYGRTDPGYNDSWGQKVTNGSDRHLKEFYKTGINRINSISFSGGNDMAQTYLSYSNSDAKGVLPENNMVQHTATLKVSSLFLNNRLSVDGSMNYLSRKIYNQNVTGGYSSVTGIISFPIDDDWSLYSGDNFEVWDPVRQVKVQNWPYLRNEWQPSQNPYWVQHRNQTDDISNKLVSAVSAKYKLTSWLNVQGRATHEFGSTRGEKRNYASTISTVEGRNGGYSVGKAEGNNLYTDLLLIGEKQIGSSIGLSGILGFSHRHSVNSGMSMGSTVQTSLAFPNYFSIYALTGLFDKSEALTKSASQAVFGNATLNYNESLFLDVTARNEWSSTVATPYFYPSVGLSYIFTQLQNDALSFAKLRGSYSEVGNGLPFGISNTTPPYTLDNSGNIIGRGTLPYFNGSDTIQLRPERTRSFEFGVDLRFFSNRLSLNLTYYNARTFDQVFQIQAPAGSGAQNFWINGGEVDNRGIEGVISYNASFDHLKWVASMNFSHNANRILKLSDKLSADRFVLTSSPYGSIFLSRPKDGKYGSFGDVFGKKFLTTENGDYVTDGANIPLLSDAEQFIGNANPKLLLGFNNSFSYKRFLFSFLIDSRFGGHVIDRTQVWLDYKGLSKETGDARDRGGVMVNGNLADAKAYYLNRSGTGSSPALSEYFHDATNIRVRELALGYTLPRITKGVESLTLSFIVRNLLFLYKSAPFDPEVGVGPSPSQEGFANFTLPATRTLGLSLNVVFSEKKQF